MNSTAALRSPISKEARALAVPWLACVLCMVLPSVLDDPRMLGLSLSVSAYFLGAAALGALSVGHEYTGRTLSLLLSLPARRQHLLAVKLGVLATMLLTLCAVAYTLVFGDARLPQSIRQTASWVPVFGGLFLAPWLTMLCRSAIGGAVFTIGIEGTLYVIGELLGARLYGDYVMQAFRLAFVWYGTIGLCVVGCIGTWRMFMRLESIEGPGQHVRLPHWLRGSAAVGSSPLALTRRHPVWLLVQKELHLQQLPLALAALFVITWPAAKWATASAADSSHESLLDACVFLYAGLLPMLIGASACAGERQIGMLEWQIIQPMSVSKQWSIKLAVVFGLALLLAVALPMMLLYVSNVGMIRHPMMFVRPEQTLVIALLLLTSGSLYISSLCGSALWALVMSIPIAMAASAFFQVAWGHVAEPVNRFAMRWAMQLLRPETIGTIDDMRIIYGFTVLLILGFIALTLRLALTNHRSADRASVRVWRQLTILAVFAIGAIMLHSTARGIIVANNMLQLPPQFRSR